MVGPQTELYALEHIRVVLHDENLLRAHALPTSAPEKMLDGCIGFRHEDRERRSNPKHRGPAFRSGLQGTPGKITDRPQALDFHSELPMTPLE